MAPREKYKTSSLKNKLEATQDVGQAIKKTKVAQRYRINLSTWSSIVKAKDRFRNESTKFAPARKRLRDGMHPKLEALVSWAKQARSGNLPVSGPILCEKGMTIVQQMGIEEFKCNDGWISKFKQRNGFTFKTVSNEAVAADTVLTSKWQQTRLQELLKEYAPENIFNADECAIFYKCLPSKTCLGER